MTKTKKQMPKMVLEGVITNIHHDHTGQIGHNLNQKLVPKKSGKGLEIKQDPYEYSAIDIKVGNAEMTIIRPLAKQFFWNNPDSVPIVSGNTIRVTIEVLEDAPPR